MKPLVWLIIAFFCLTPTVKAQVWLNEISAASSPEYVELFNNSAEKIELNNWFIDDVADKGSAPKIFSLTLPSQGFGIVELNSMLNNSGGDSVRLLDQNQNEIDRYDYTINLSLTDIFIRCPDGGETWILTTLSTKALSNHPSCLLLTPTLFPEITLFPSLTNIPTLISNPTVFLSPTPTLSPLPALEVFLSEVLVYPDDEAEWVELYNPNSQTITLTNWYLDDKENSGSSPKQFSLTIDGQSFGLIKLSSQIFNNTGDQVRLLDQDFKETDRFEYNQTNKNQTFSRTKLAKTSPWCETEPTPNQHNSDCLSSKTEIINSTTTVNLLTPAINPSDSHILESTFQISSPVNLQFSGNLYQLPKPKVLGAEINQSKISTSELVFWQQFTKISLWLNLLINVVLLVYLSSFLLPYSLWSYGC